MPTRTFYLADTLTPAIVAIDVDTANYRRFRRLVCEGRTLSAPLYPIGDDPRPHTCACCGGRSMLLPAWQEY
jgi:hypothetical protein